jgi:uncharacterized protein
MHEILKILFSIWQILGEMSVYLLFGFFVAGLLHVLIPQSFIEKHLSGKGILKSIKAALIGVPMPLCSCGVIPVTASLKKHGAGKGATISFLTSTPQTGVDSILITYGLLGWMFAVIRVVTAFISGIVCGALTELLDKEEVVPEPASVNSEIKGGSKIVEVFRYGFLNLPQDIGKSLIIGLIIAGLITTLIPKDFFTAYLNNTFLSMLVMLLVGLPLYVCSTASVPVAAAFLQMGINPGAVLVFLITGPATNAATITIITKILNKKTAVIYLITIAVSALLAGAVLNLIMPNTAHLISHMTHRMLPMWIKHTGAVVLLAVLAFSYINKMRAKKTCSRDTVDGDILELKAEGITCSHCADSIKRELSGFDNITSVNVDITGGTVQIGGTNLNKDELSEAIVSLGFKVEK